MKFTYVMIDFFSVIVPFLFSFHPRIRFYKYWLALFPAIITTALLFIAWDMYFTRIKIWGFNPQYLTGINIGNLPIEEVLFFICIPYSCIFTYSCLNEIISKRISISLQSAISISLIAISIYLSIKYIELRYTTCTFALLAILLIITRFIIKANWLSQFFVTYLFLLIPFLIVNGLLTGTGLASPVVWYNHAEITNMRILTIPFEDFFYGMDLILLNIAFYSLFTEKFIKVAPPPRDNHLIVKDRSYT
jgi:lycopene cyclase domain-containing protein